MSRSSMFCASTAASAAIRSFGEDVKSRSATLSEMPYRVGEGERGSSGGVSGRRLVDSIQSVLYTGAVCQTTYLLAFQFGKAIFLAGR